MSRFFRFFLRAVVATVLAGSFPALAFADPVITAIPDQTVPVGKSVVVPVTVSGTGPMTFTVSSSNAKIIAVVKTGNPFMKIHVDYAGTGSFSGDLTFQLFRDMTPKTVGFIGGFAQAGFYDGLIFHRILALSGSPSSVIAQAGDPLGTGLGGPGFQFDNELSAPLIFDGKGQLAMANSNGTAGYQGTNGSQFFITRGSLRFLDFNHTIFGQLVRGFDVLDQIDAVQTDGNGKPLVDVKMTKVELVKDDTDAVMLVSALTTTGTAGSQVIIAAKDVNGTASAPVAFNVIAADDTVNDPPFLKKSPDVVAALHQTAHVPLSANDLEFDFLSFNQSSQTTFLSNPSSASGSFSGNVVNIIPNATTPKGAVILGTSVVQFGATVLRTDPFDHSLVNVGLGDKRLTPVNTVFVSATGAPLTSGTVGSFGDADPLATAADFTTTINWGDGTPVVTGTDVTLTRTARPAPSGFAVSAAPHIYAKPGIYAPTIAVRDSLGATATIENTAVITTGTETLAALGRSLVIPHGVLSKRLVATFKDSTGVGTSRDYTARIDWGDGTISSGSIRASRDGFGVYGTHSYKTNLPAAINVTVTKTATSETANAWSRAEMTAVNTPGAAPFPMTHIFAAFNGSVARNTALLPIFYTVPIFIANSGNKASGPVELKFYLSKNNTLDKTGPSADQPLLVGLQPSLKFNTVKPGQIISGPVPNIRIIPAFDADQTPRFLIMETIYSDPLGDHMPGNKPAERVTVSAQFTPQ